MNLTDEQIQKRFEALWPEFLQQVRREFGGRSLIHCKGGKFDLYPGAARIADAQEISATLSVSNGVYWSAGVAMTPDELRALAAQAIAASIEIDAKAEQK